MGLLPDAGIWTAKIIIRKPSCAPPESKQTKALLDEQQAQEQHENAHQHEHRLVPEKRLSSIEENLKSSASPPRSSSQRDAGHQQQHSRHAGKGICPTNMQGLRPRGFIGAPVRPETDIFRSFRTEPERITGKDRRDMKEYYEGKVAVVTGGASGIGLALCEMLLSFNAKAVVVADVNADKLSKESERLTATFPGKALGVLTDVTRKESIDALIRQATEFGAGRIDFLFNNAGAALMKPFDETTAADWRFAFEVNFFSALHGIRAVLPVMRAQGGGHIANTASGIAFSPMPVQSMYSATKSAVNALTLSLRSELWDDNIRLSTVIPGTVATPMWEEAGGAPANAITPEQSAMGILEGLSKNERIVIVTNEDRVGATNCFRPDGGPQLDAYFLSVARRRKSGETGAL
jgi:NAD(P)-dependent dehydrogenase (short-subunit alcohol dehydrogenase family)